MKIFSRGILGFLIVLSTIAHEFFMRAPVKAQVVHPWIIKEDTFETPEEEKHEEGRINREVTK